jgi:CBS domain containing-hemolysin-like protein
LTEVPSIVAAPKMSTVALRQLQAHVCLKLYIFNDLIGISCFLQNATTLGRFNNHRHLLHTLVRLHAASLGVLKIGPFAFAATKGVQLANFRPLRPVNKLMETFTKLGDTIFDPFLGGSGIEMTEWSSNEALAGRWAFLFFVARSSDHSKRNYCTK